MSSNYERKAKVLRRNIAITTGGGMGYNFSCGINEKNEVYDSRANTFDVSDEAVLQRDRMQRHLTNAEFIYRVNNPPTRPYNTNH
jgi:hypothetical protein